jgi:putative SOS response-associated peptidase YedK
MCGRFALVTPGEEIAETFGLTEVPELVARYNIAPTQPVVAVRVAPQSKLDNQRRELTLLHWGLIPSWAKDPSISARLINARAETAAEKPSFRSALKYRRCLVPADGFYEWQKVDGKKQPYFIRLRDDGPFAIAGLWEHWQSPDGSEIESVTLLTTAANDAVRPLHDRMPVIIAPADYGLWLDTAVQKAEGVQHLLRPFDATAMLAYPVNPLVNNARNDTAVCLQPFSE